MALKQCKECGHQISTKATQCPQCGAVIKKKTGCLGYIVAGILIVAVVKIVVSMSGGENTRNTSGSQNEPQQTKIQPASKQESKPNQPKSPWVYSADEYKMGKGKINRAINQSVNTVNFSFPYQGAQRGTLILRTHPKYGKDIIFRIQKGQILTTIGESTYILARFDDGNPVKFKILASEDHDNTTVFFKDYYGFAKKMLKAKRVRLSANIYQQGSPIFEFNVTEFSQKDYITNK